MACAKAWSSVSASFSSSRQACLSGSGAIRWALELRKPIVLVYFTDAREGHGNPEFQFYANQIKRTFPSKEHKDDHDWLLKGIAVPYDQRGGYDALMVAGILKQIPRTQVEGGLARRSAW
jgi:hypothetical protein